MNKLLTLLITLPCIILGSSACAIEPRVKQALWGAGKIGVGSLGLLATKDFIRTMDIDRRGIESYDRNRINLCSDFIVGATQVALPLQLIASGATDIYNGLYKTDKKDTQEIHIRPQSTYKSATGILKTWLAGASLGLSVYRIKEDWEYTEYNELTPSTLGLRTLTNACQSYMSIELFKSGLQDIDQSCADQPPKNLFYRTLAKGGAFFAALLAHELQPHPIR